MEAATIQEQCAAMTKIQKLAALLIILGPDSAAQLLKNLNQEELEAVSSEMTLLTYISQEMQQEILAEFTEVAVTASTAVTGGPAFAKNALEKSIGAAKASDILRRVSTPTVPEMQSLLELEPAELYTLLKQEQPQTIALIISYLTPDKSSQLLAMLTPSAREQIVERLATMGPTPVEVLERIVKVLNSRKSPKPVRSLGRTGGLKSAAAVLNMLDRNLSQSLLLDLERHNPQLGQEIRQKMFTFEDLALLGPAALQRVMRDVDMRDLAVALKTASVKVRNCALAALSKRAAGTVNEELAMLGPLKRREIEAAQARILQIARQLEGGGEIDLNNLRDFYRNELLV
jgi:flagellar motor switch protein FliG